MAPCNSAMEHEMTLENTFARAKGWAISRVLRFQQWTWRLEVEGRDGYDQLVKNGDRFILCFWHGKYVPILPIMRGNNACVFTSETRRGDVIAQICREFGYRYTQIPDRGGNRSLRRMEAALSETRSAGIAVDGPLGPYHVVKHGVVRLASRLDFLLLPVSVDAGRKHVLTERWDLMEIPCLFTRVRLVIGDPITVPASLGQEGIAAFSLQLSQALESLDERVTSLVRKR